MTLTRKAARKLVRRALAKNKSDKPFQAFKRSMTVFNRCRETRCAKETKKLKDVDAQIDRACPPVSIAAMANDPSKAKRYGDCMRKQDRLFKREAVVRRFMACGEKACASEYKDSVAKRDAMV